MRHFVELQVTKNTKCPEAGPYAYTSEYNTLYCLPYGKKAGRTAREAVKELTTMANKELKNYSIVNLVVWRGHNGRVIYIKDSNELFG